MILSLFDITGNMLEPWIDEEVCVCVDIQHKEKQLPRFIQAGNIYKVNWDVHAIGFYMQRKPAPSIIFGFPPCTDLAVSGARWFKSKAAEDPLFQEKAVYLARKVETLGNYYNVPWMLENPVGRLSTLWRKPDHWFHPYEYTAYCSDDNYTKKTGIWCGNGFVMPPVSRNLTLGEPDDRIHKAAPSDERANFRSATPRGFARAVYKANQKVIL